MGWLAGLLRCGEPFHQLLVPCHEVVFLYELAADDAAGHACAFPGLALGFPFLQHGLGLALQGLAAWQVRHHHTVRGACSAGVAGLGVEGFDQVVQQFGVLVCGRVLLGLLHGLLVALGHLRMYQGQAQGVEDGCGHYPNHGALEPAHGAALQFVTAWLRARWILLSVHG